MTDPITRLTAARFDGPQALYTEAVRLLSERPALPDDLAGLVARLREPWFTNGCAAYQHEAADAIEALSAIPLRPEAEVRAEAWAAAIEAAAVKCIPWSLACSEEISASTPPADISAALDRIKAEAKAEGMREAARIAADHTPEKHGGAPLAAHVTGKSIELAILAAIPEVRK